MATRDFNETVQARAVRDSDFAKVLLSEAATLFLNGEPNTARLILRDLVNASVGFAALAAETKHSSRSLHRILSEKGNPSVDKLAVIFGALRKRLGMRRTRSRPREAAMPSEAVTSEARSFGNMWDALEDRPAAAANMRPMATYT